VAQAFIRNFLQGLSAAQRILRNNAMFGSYRVKHDRALDDVSLVRSFVLVGIAKTLFPTEIIPRLCRLGPPFDADIKSDVA